MLTTNLFEEVLLKPAKEGADSLYIVSGYASATMAASQFEELANLKSYPKVNLIIGMFPQIGNLRSNHLAFQTLSSEDYPTTFECRYVIKSPPVHIKAYAWYKDGLPYRGFIGSANYAKNAFGLSQREAVTVCEASYIKSYFDALLNETVDCRDDEADRLVSEALQKAVAQRQIEVAEAIDETVSPAGSRYTGLEHRRISFLDNKGELPAVSGLNWGQRPGRNPNQAYIRVPSSIATTNFFPPKTELFTVVTDDDKSLICTRAQEEIAKAIHSPLNNSEIGLYFRNRLGLASGAFVTKADLERYGRTSVDFYKIDDETYLMDFSPSSV